MNLITYFVWYNPEHDWIVLHTVTMCGGCCFEWDIGDLQEANEIFGREKDPFYETTWLPVGEL